MRLVFMGTPEFAVPSLKALCESGHDIVAVYSQPPRPAGRGQKEKLSPVHCYATQLGLSVLTPVSLKSAETQAEFAAHRADAAIVAAYGLLLPKPILEAFPLGCINVHPSLLPRWRGAAPIQRTIMAGDKETAIVIMQMNEGLDTGDMLMVEHSNIADDMTAGQLHDLLAEKAGVLLLKTLDGLQNHAIKPVKQPDDGVTYAKKITKEECRIGWTASAKDIYNKIRGLNPHPGAYFVYKGESIKIFSAAFSGAPSNNAPGTFLASEKMIVCGHGMLAPIVVQRPGKKPMPMEEMLRGHPIPDGTILE